MGESGNCSTLDTKMVLSTCTQLASVLSENYASTLPFTGSSHQDLTDYLTNNGVLLSVCLGDGFCNHQASETKISSSWINVQLGMRTIPAANPIGMIFDPAAVEIACIYPTDGATDSRDDDGCGPQASDPNYGSQGAHNMTPYQKSISRLGFQQSIEYNFGENASYEKLPCP